MKKIKKILKITAATIGILFLILFVSIHILLIPKSDKKIIEKLTNPFSTPHIYYNQYKNFKYRVVAMQKEIDTTLVTVVFVHGSPGSSLDFKEYLKDSSINLGANLIAYDRVGYGPENTGNVQGSISFELKILNDVIKEIDPQKIVLVGYSYGGPIVLASPKNYKYKVSLASAISGSLEPMFWTLNFYKWKITKPLIPSILRAAAKEKFSHLKDLPKYDKKWNISPAPVVNIQGNEDWIVPFENSNILQKKITPKKFSMVTIKGGGHGLVWSNFPLIRNEIVKTLH
jgi:pimeloyl-ACP methyl ester carboxylesterase